MIDRKGRVPDVRRVAILANIACLYMGEWLARSFNAIVATGTISRDVYVVEIRWQPGDRGVAIVACVPAGDVGWMFSCRREPVMTGATGAQNLRMVHGISRCPDIAVMTVFADIGRLYVT